MVSLKRIGTAIGFALLATTSSSYSADPTVAADQAKYTTIQSILAESNDLSVWNEEWVKRAERALDLTGMVVDSSSHSPGITLTSSKVPLYRIEKGMDGKTIKLFLMDTVLSEQLKRMDIEGGQLIDRVNVSQTGVSPQFITTVEISLHEPASIQSVQRNKELSIKVVPESEKLDRASMSNSILMEPQIAHAALNEAWLRANEELLKAKDFCGNTLYKAVQQMETAKVQLLEAELSLVVHTSDQPVTQFAQMQNKLANHEESLKLVARTYQNSLNQLKNERLSSESKIDKSIASISLNSQSTNSEWKDQLVALQKDLGKIVESAKSNHTVLVEKIRAIGVRINSEIQETENLAVRISALSDSQEVSSTHKNTEDSLDQLGAAVDSLRVAKADTFVAEKSTDGLASVAPQNLDVTTMIDTPVAAIATKAAPSAGAQTVVPPTPRVRPAKQSLTRHQVNHPGKLAFLSAEPDALAKAEQDGILVMAQQVTDETREAVTVVSAPKSLKENGSKPRRLLVPKQSSVRPTFGLYNPNLAPEDDPLRKIVTINFKEMNLNEIVMLLGEMAGINILSGADLSGTVTAHMKEIPLGRAIVMVLRMEGFGIIEEAGVYRITTYEEAVASKRDTQMVFLKNADAVAVKATLDEVIKSTGDVVGGQLNVGANPETNVIVLSGPRERVEEFAAVVAELDVTEPIIPTVSKAIHLNYSDPMELSEALKPLLTESGNVAFDNRSRQIVLTDIPVKVKELEILVASLDLKVKSVSIEAMVVDALISDGAETGIDWFAQNRNIHNLSTLSQPGEEAEGFQESALTLGSLLGGPLTGGQIAFQKIAGDVIIDGVISAQIASQNAELIANPSITTVENEPAVIKIIQEFPYNELTQTDAGASIATTEFKEIGTILEVTPRVTFEQDIMATIHASQSNIIGLTEIDRIPIEAKREATTTLVLDDGQSVMIGGLRRFDESITESKVPILGDIPILGVLFKQQLTDERQTELMIFITCNIVPENLPELTPYEKTQYDRIGGMEMEVNGSKTVWDNYMSKDQNRKPFYKWRRSK
jgi:type II secretory pathway component GspD/PulD (secretin)